VVSVIAFISSYYFLVFGSSERGGFSFTMAGRRHIRTWKDRTMKRLSPVWRESGLALGLCLLVSGCETVQDHSLSYKLWDNSDLSKWSEPSSNPRLALFESPDHTRLLVVYDAVSEKHSVVKRQAYYLELNQARISAGKAPRFTDPAASEGMTPIPVFEAATFATNPPTQLTNYAILSESGREFTLHPQAERLGAFQLPAYPESSGTMVRVALTPLAAVGDTAMVGVVGVPADPILGC
jgi:hypothetical protein